MRVSYLSCVLWRVKTSSRLRTHFLLVIVVTSDVYVKSKPQRHKNCFLSVKHLPLAKIRLISLHLLMHFSIKKNLSLNIVISNAFLVTKIKNHHWNISPNKSNTQLLYSFLINNFKWLGVIDEWIQFLTPETCLIHIWYFKFFSKIPWSWIWPDEIVILI